MSQSSANSVDGRLLGHVEQFDFDRGLGMIWSSGQEYLFHCAEIVDGTRDINIGEIGSHSWWPIVSDMSKHLKLKSFRANRAVRFL